jgi:serine O-acetyltransferase
MKIKTTFGEAVREDLRMQGVALSLNAGTLRFLRHAIPTFILKPSFACIVCYRINRGLYKKSRILGRLFHVWRYYTFANDISFFADIGPGCHLSHTTGIVIGRGVVIGKNCKIYQNVTLGAKHFEKPDEKPIIGNNVTIGAGACVLGNITIGSNTEIGALTFCGQSVPDNSIAYGYPLIIKPKKPT